jgi:aspartate dehydrogenase
MAIIGYGAIGCEIGAALGRLGESEDLAAALVRRGRSAGPFAAVHDVGALLANAPQTILECAGQASVGEYGPPILAAGVDLVLSSIGTLADPQIVSDLASAAAGGGRLLFAPGAVAGLDGLIAARLAGLASVTYTSFKPPEAWRGVVAADIDLDGPDEEILLFDGSARAAALAFPRNANVAVAIGLCGLGLDATRARLVSSRKVQDPLGLIEAEGDFGRFTFEILAHAAPTNPRSSLLTAHSLLQCARLGLGLPALPLLGPEEPCAR